MSAKQCFKCEEVKHLEEFYKHPKMADRRSGKCKTCTKTDSTANRNKNIDRIREYDRARGCRQPAGYLAAWRAENPRKWAAHQAISNAVRTGKMRALPCEVCADPETHGHHDDYAYPLSVRWLCAAHHKQWHEQNGEAPNGK